MNTFQKTAAALGLAVLAFGTLSFGPASAQVVHPLHHPMKHAAKLERKAAHASMMGHPRKAARLRAHAARLRAAAHHAY